MKIFSETTAIQNFSIFVGLPCANKAVLFAISGKAKAGRNE
jgi:hypothetical protein